MKSIGTLLMTLTALFQVSAASAEITAFGFTLGKTTYAEVQSKGSTTGTNLYSNGPMVKLERGAVDLEGLQNFLLIFDAENRLAAMMLTLGKHRFDTIHGHLSGRYAIRESQIPFVGNRYVRYGAPGATIELDAPHLSFEMTLMYQRDEFRKTFLEHQQREREAKQRREADQF